MIQGLSKALNRMHYPLEVMLVCVRWYATYPLSLRQIEEFIAERGVAVDQATVHRWSIKMLPLLAAVFRRHKRAVGVSWRMDETYIKVRTQRKYLYGAVDRAGDTIDFLLCPHRDYAAARRFFGRVVDLHGVPQGTTIDKGGANRSTSITSPSWTTGQSRESCDPCSGSRTSAARALVAGIETMHMMKKGQLDSSKDQASSGADQFYSLAF